VRAWPLIVARVLFGAAVLMVTWTSLLPPEDLPTTFGLSDKVLHLLGYAVLGVLAALSGLRWPLALAAVVGLGLVLEMAQGAFGYRSFEWLDLVADALGAAAGVLVTSRIVDEVRRRRSARAHEAKREARRQRRERERNPQPERPMNTAKAAARKGAPSWQVVGQRTGTKCWLCGRRTHEDDRRREADGSYRLGSTYPTVVFVNRIDQGGTYEVENARIAHRHCAALRESNPGRREYGTPRRTYA
jgi:VanZ family protein